jgi:glycine/D-amino acid oxidase-like deaminating enzyme
MCVSRYFPSFRPLRVLRGWSAPVAYTQDSCPWLGPVAGMDGLFLATAFRSTVIVTPLVGELVVQLVTGEKCDLIIDDFLPERNANHAC